MSGCNQTEKNEDKIGVGNPEEELAVSPYTSGEAILTCLLKNWIRIKKN